jgi:hypothetical protein
MTETSTPHLDAPDFQRQAPGTILRDFDALLDLIGDPGLPVTPGHLLTLKTLETINQRLTHPLELGLKRAIQKSYPHINGLYLLLRSSGLALIDTAPKKPRLQLDPVVLASWHSLNGAERYFALLKAWWVRSSEEAIGERPSWEDVMTKAMNFISQFPRTGKQVYETPQDSTGLRYRPGFHNLALMELFGLLEIRTLAPAEGQGWQPAQMRLTDWGKSLANHYADFIEQARARNTDLVIPGLYFGELFDPLVRFEQWSLVLRPEIKGWQNELEIPSLQFHPGQHQFKVSLGAKCWRRIAIGGESGLDALASTILSSFHFDSDHLYRFSYQDRFGHLVEIDHPAMVDESEHVADEVKVGDLPLCEGMRINFLFDFGDDWRFELMVERVNTGPASRKPQVLEEQGTAPEQYPGQDDHW